MKPEALRRMRAIALAGAAIVCISSAPLPAPPHYTVLIRGGMLLDGTGGPPRRGDVGIVGDRIMAVGLLDGAAADRVIEAKGLFVTPGFINVHDHGSPDALPTAPNMLTQGVTTSIINPDGQGGTDVGGQLRELGRHPLAVNVGAAIGFNAVWRDVVGERDRRPSPDELDRIGRVIATNLADGAWAVSAGLDYKPAFFARTDEVVRALRPAGAWRTIFPNHDRLTPDHGFSSRAAIDETIAIGEQAGLVPVVTHMKAQGRSQGEAPAMLGDIQAASRSGRYAAADVYPYLAGQTGLASLFVPGWAADGGPSAFFARLQQPDLRARIVHDMEEAMAARVGGPDNVQLLTTGRTLREEMASRRVGAGEAILRILLEKPTTEAILTFGREDDLRAILRFPAAAIACDCGASLEQDLHPRYWGTFPRVLGHYVRDQHVLTWPDAVRKMTGLPATMIGLVDRGFLAPGMMADVTLFDPATINDRATYAAPITPSVGVRWVLVNGRIALADGSMTGTAGGRTLLRASYMPSRPESRGDRRVTGGARLSGGSRTVRFDLRQSATATSARGFLDIGEEVRRARFGILQTARGWFSITGVVEAGRRAGQAFVLTGDSLDPRYPGQRRIHLSFVGGDDIGGRWMPAGHR